MRIATWNLGRPTGGRSSRAARLTEWIRRIDADMWVLTETHEAISPGTEFACLATTETDRPQRPGEQWAAIWSRLPLAAGAATCDPARSVSGRIAIDERRTLLVYALVLPWRGDRRWLPLAGGRAFVERLERHAGDWRHLRDELPNDLLCVAGDFNQELVGRNYAGTARGATALRQTLADADLRCLTGDEADPVARLLGGERSNIDHICLDRRVAGCNAMKTGAWPPTHAELKGLTDHFGVWADVIT